ncbi:MAG: 23S rRNA pseudouridine1911/1915/1917 synthase [Pseudohongiellaceae bacterium]|jgi:23S rRNA pseudouridine1911/1915/1917 synthase
MTDTTSAEDSSVPSQLVTPEGRLSYRVIQEDVGSRIDRLLGRLLAPTYSRSYLAALISEGTIKVTGEAVRPSYRVEIGTLVEGELGSPAAALPGPEPMDLSVLYEDESLIVINKPIGMIIHPGTGASSGTLVNGLLSRFPELSVVGRADRPGIIHRLDRDTSGVLLVARTNEAAKSLVNQFKAKTVQKQYSAVVWGELPFDSDWIDLPLGPQIKKPQLRRVVRDGGQESSTFYEVRERFGVACHLAVFPRTGRTHQIRVHLEHLGFPIIADSSYGSQFRQQYRGWVAKRQAQGLAAPELTRQALHAHKITIRHPATNEECTFEAPMPDDIQALLKVLSIVASEG